jgi:hypothetical protein
MMSLKSWGMSFCFIATSALTSGIASAQSDNPNSDLSIDPDENVQVVYAVYGGVNYDKTASHYENVTEKVSDLLKKSPLGFSVTEDAVLGKHGTDWVQSLLIIYNYEQQSYFYNIPEGGGTVSVDKLKSWAKTHRNAKIGTPIDKPASDDFHVVFAAYGVGDMFINATYPIRKLLHDQPDGFMVTDDEMGGDPHPYWTKVLIVIFDDSSGRHLYSMFNLGPHVSMDALKDAAKSN